MESNSDSVNQFDVLAAAVLVVLAGVTGVLPEAPLELTIVDPLGFVCTVTGVGGAIGAAGEGAAQAAD